MVNSLWIWMNGERVARWNVTRSTHQLVYEESWLASPRGRPLSLSLPLTAGRVVSGAAVEHFFGNLLPDSRVIRDRLRRRLAITGTDAFDLLAAIGRDCVGAIQLLPPEMEPRGFDRVDGVPLTTEQIEHWLLGVTADPAQLADDLFDDDAWRISLAGAQEKTALLRIGDQWCRPQGATPSTHILKLPLGLVANQRADMRDSVYNEWLCLTLLRELGLPAANGEICTFGAQTVLAVERFDRQWQQRPDGQPWIARLPQEDLCQALGLPPEQKYEVTDANGRTTGPTMDDALSVLRAGTEPDNDVALFLLAQLMNWVLGNTDAHGKNFSIFLLPGGRHAMTPLYDVISLWPIVGDAPSQLRQKQMRLALALRARRTLRKLDDIHGSDWAFAARRSGVTGLEEMMVGLMKAVPAALDHLVAHLPEGFPPRLLERMLPVIRQRAATAAATIAAA